MCRGLPPREGDVDRRREPAELEVVRRGVPSFSGLAYQGQYVGPGGTGYSKMHFSRRHVFSAGAAFRQRHRPASHRVLGYEGI